MEVLESVILFLLFIALVLCIVVFIGFMILLMRLTYILIVDSFTKDNDYEEH